MTLVNIVERLPRSEQDVRVIVRGVAYELGVATCRYLGRPSLELGRRRDRPRRPRG